MRVQVAYLDGSAEVVQVTASAKLSFERKHKKPLRDEIETGMLESLYDVVHRALRIQKADETPEEMDEWLGTVADLIVKPPDPMAYFMLVCHDMNADEVEHTAMIVQTIAELKRAGEAMPEPEIPTGGETTASPDVSPEPASGRASTRTGSSRSRKKTTTSTSASS